MSLVVPTLPRFPAFLLLGGLLLGACDEKPVVRVLTDRTASHLEPLFEAFASSHRFRVEANYVGDGLLTRLRARPREADVVITKEAELLEIAQREGLLAPARSPALERLLPAEQRVPGDAYVLLSYRARVIFYAEDRVKPEALSGYLDLADPKWRGRICLRSGLHDYNVALFAQLAAIHGLEKTTAFFTGLKANLARRPIGNDRAQVRGIHEGVCDLALANSYYAGIMHSRDDQRAWMESARVFFPDQENGGTLVLYSAGALTAAGAEKKHALRLLEYLLDEAGQTYLARSLYAYPIRPDIPLAPFTARLGREQGITGGRFRRRAVPLADSVAQRDAVISTLARIRFDEPD